MNKNYLTIAMLMLGCSQPETGGLILGVQLLTDLETGTDFASIEVEVEGAQGKRRAGALTEPLAYLEPQRVADFRGLAPDATRRITLRLRHRSGRDVIERSVMLDHRSSATRTIMITRSCVDMRCKDGDKTSCLGGECVKEACIDGTESACAGRDASCTSDQDCAAASCQQSRCMNNSCLVFAASDCDAGVTLSDAGSEDAGMQEGGSILPTPPPDAGGGTGECDGSLCQLDAACARHTYEQHVYWLCQKSRVHNDASLFCASAGATLVVISSPGENEFVKKLIQRASGVSDRRAPHYIGLDDNAFEGDFVWADGSPLDFSAWEVGAPANSTNNICGSENCTQMWAQGTWNDTCCLGMFPFLCESK